MPVTCAFEMAAYCLSARKNRSWTVGRAVVRCIYIPHTQIIRFELDGRWIVPAETVDQLLIDNHPQALHRNTEGRGGNG